MTDFFDTTVGKTVKAAVYVAVSAIVSYLVTATTSTPDLFGPLTVVVNAVLVAIKGLIDPQTPNI